MKAIQIDTFGGPDVMKYVDLPDPVPSADEVLLNVTAVGINYADTHQTENSYLSPQKLPLVPGIEVVGTHDGKRYLASVSSGDMPRRLSHINQFSFQFLMPLQMNKRSACWFKELLPGIC